MKKVMALILSLAPVFMYAQTSKTVPYQLNGEVNFPKADESGRKIYFMYVQMGKQKIDSAIIQKNKFSFTGKVDVNLKASLQLTRPNATPEPALDPNNVTFYLNNGKTTLKAKGNLSRAQIEGSPVQLEYAQFKRTFTRMDRSITSLGWRKRGVNDSLKLKTINNSIDSAKNLKMNELCSFLEANNQKPYATEAILLYLKTKGSSLSVVKAKEYFNKLGSEQKNSPDGLEIEKILSGDKSEAHPLVKTIPVYPALNDKNSLSVLKDVAFYDGYARPVDFPVPVGLIRVSNTKYVRKLSEIEKQKLGDSLVIKLTLNAGCDNYDRIGRVTVLSTSKGTAYDGPDAHQFEVLRIMTPFNYKTRQPDQTPYSADISQLASLFNDKKLDIWILTEIFGTTGVGQKETIGCDGSLLTYTCNVDILSKPLKQSTHPEILPLLSYYSLNGQDTTAGHNAKEVTFKLTKDVQSAMVYLITSGHGAAQGGEEYNWREHVLYLDNREYTRLSVNQDCASFEIYNTRINGIYGGGNIINQRRSWCPGAAVPIRLINLGPLKAGNHQLKITVPDANLLSTKSTYYLSAYVVAN